MLLLGPMPDAVRIVVRRLVAEARSENPDADERLGCRTGNSDQLDILVLRVTVGVSTGGQFAPGRVSPRALRGAG